MNEKIQELLQIVENLPDPDVSEVLNWARYLAKNQAARQIEVKPASPAKAAPLADGGMWEHDTRDLFLLGTPRLCSDELTRSQLALQAQFGGRLITPAHFTIRRFRFNDEAECHVFLNELRQVVGKMPAFPLKSFSVVSVYSEFRQARVMKWHIILSQPLQTLTDTIEQLIVRSGGKSLVPSRWISDQITALEGIEDMGFFRDLLQIPIPDPLFNIEQVNLAYYSPEQDFQTLETFPLLVAA